MGQKCKQQKLPRPQTHNSTQIQASVRQSQRGTGHDDANPGQGALATQIQTVRRCHGHGYGRHHRATKKARTDKNHRAGIDNHTGSHFQRRHHAHHADEAKQQPTDQIGQPGPVAQYPQIEALQHAQGKQQRSAFDDLYCHVHPNRDGTQCLINVLSPKSFFQGIMTAR